MLSEEEPREARKAKQALKTLAENSGGVDYYPKDLAEVDKMCLKIAHEIRDQYMLAYHADEHGAGRNVPQDHAWW